MKQRTIRDSFNKELMVTSYLDGSITIMVGNRTVDFRPNHPQAEELRKLAGGK